jgi:hypothetical protein
VYKHIFINAEFQIGTRSKKTEQTGRGPLRRQRSALDFSAIEKEEVCLFCFTNCCHVSSCPYKRHGAEARNSS